MSNVIDFCTGEPIRPRSLPKRKAVQEVIDGLSQRKHQISDIVVGYFEKSTGQFRFSCAACDTLNMQLIQLNLNNYLSDLSLPD